MNLFDRCRIAAGSGVCLGSGMAHHYVLFLILGGFLAYWALPIGQTIRYLKGKK